MSSASLTFIQISGETGLSLKSQVASFLQMENEIEDRGGGMLSIGSSGYSGARIPSPQYVRLELQEYIP